MRLHTLRITAFGPFADSVSVDFDALSDGGLFLLTGPTGAGKSSVLDAVCFALYGQVPGDRQAARQLRCDRADPTAAPEVVLEASIRGRRLRFTRSPQWERPKRRGTGLVRVQAHVVVEELCDGAWTGLTNRLDDTGLLVTDLLGMTCSQFTQVAMLPQGRFMTFLRARSEERQQVLQTLFRTDRFERVERWLVDRRIELRHAGQAANDRVAAVLNRLQEAGAVSVPDTWELTDLSPVAEAGDVVTWAAGLREQATAEAAAAAARRTEATGAAESDTAALAAGRRLHELQQRGRAARAREAELTAGADAATADAAALAAHDRAQAVLGPARRAERARRTADDAARRAEQALDAAAAVLDGALDDLASAEERATGQLAVAESFRPRQAELERLARQCAELADERLRLAQEGDRLQQRLDTLPAELAEATHRLEAARDAAARVEAAALEATRAEDACAAAEELTVLTAELHSAEVRLLAARDTALGLREVWLDVREARIHGMAGELAGGLAVGCACPVCGSPEHPSPAGSVAGAVGRAEEDAARRAHEEAEFAHQVLAGEIADLRARLAALRARAGDLDVDSARAAARAARDLLSDLQARSAGLARLEGTLAELREAHEEARRRRETLAARLAGIRSAHQAAAEQAESLTAELAALLADAGVGTLDELVALRVRARDLLVRARARRQEQSLAESASAAAGEAAEAASREAGFDGPDAAIAAALPPQDADLLRRRLEDRRRVADDVARDLADPDVTAAMDQPMPDLDALHHAASAALQARDTAVVLDEGAQARVRRLAALAADLEAALAAWAPVRADLATVTSLAALVEGKGPDNPLRIRLSAYVLGERLRQVVAAANERLDRMSGSRYILEQSDDRGAGDRRGGLSLVVRDAWSGQARDPATLSGGETFLVSLALALGLADTVCHEAGGTDIDTLFIDEGFGSLDADTLDDVMDTLDGLREGGRVVGLVSHVAELRTRIPTRLEVTKTRGGSGLRALVGTG